MVGNKFRNIEDCILYHLSLVSHKDIEGRDVGYSNDHIVGEVMKNFPQARTSVHCVAWYRSKVNTGVKQLPNGKPLPLTPRKSRQSYLAPRENRKSHYVVTKGKFEKIEDCILYHLSLVHHKDIEGRDVGYSNDHIVGEVMKNFPQAQTSVHCVAWYRSKVNTGVKQLPNGKSLPLTPRKTRKDHGHQIPYAGQAFSALREPVSIPRWMLVASVIVGAFLLFNLRS